MEKHEIAKVEKDAIKSPWQRYTPAPYLKK
jgi:hypothetical protein